jgi:hypothetical protein
MSDDILQTLAIVAAVWTVAILLSWLTHRQATRTSVPPPKSEWLRGKFAKGPATGATAYIILGTSLLPLLLPAAILIALAHSEAYWSRAED